MTQAMADVPQKASLLQVVRMVLSAFLGIRKRADHEKIVVTPLQVIIVAVIAGAMFVGTVVSVVRLVMR
jgi:hypothetical protein